MKKYLPLVLIGIFFCSSSVIKLDLMMHGDAMSTSAQATNYCMQMTTGAPLLLGIGLVLFFAPRQFFIWIYSILELKQSFTPAWVVILVWQIFGIIMIIGAISGIVNECSFLFSLQ